MEGRRWGSKPLHLLVVYLLRSGLPSDLPAEGCTRLGYACLSGRETPVVLCTINQMTAMGFARGLTIPHALLSIHDFIAV
ncbi:hypothetical protein Nepgr_016118 [Nepenthes gracilis]|uniref:Uncharacterized protein n=1 Tax=Nepenthes gracilis TaxID=150966 RepID=A0AAD3XR05_NEPGR|nr:hypothetical protein Nepgr_016118 [Nepenthes gracilis]